jgi:hypothetical protein
MFDESEKKQTDANMPIVPASVSSPIGLNKEPEDIFANVGDMGPGVSEGIPKPPVFQPKKINETALPGEESHHEPGRKKIMLAGVIVIAISLFFAGLWYGYYVLLPKLTDNNQDQSPVVQNEANPAPNPPDQENNMPNPVTPPVAEVSPAVNPDETVNPASTTAQPEMPIQQAPTGTPNISGQDSILDSDGDGLLDWEEKSLGTDIRLSDTDGDGLFDREEVRVYKTNPLDPDTDKDGYQDGSEVKGGYNPNGPGKLYEIKN